LIDCGVEKRRLRFALAVTNRDIPMIDGERETASGPTDATMSSDVVTVTTIPRLPPRRPDSNKGTYGRVLVVGGSRGMSGAAVLCASAALRGGAGLVRAAVPAEVLPIVAAANPCIMTAALPHDDAGRFAAEALAPALELAQASDVVALGPGLGRSAALTTFVTSFVRECSKPLVVDADALNAVAEDATALKRHAGPVIVTPHPGEFARLLKIDTAAVQAQRRDLCERFAHDYSLVVVLKGHATLVSDGRRTYRNPTGNPGMATAGSGDVLAGLIAALAGQGLAAFEAAQLGVHLHGLAGDLAARDLGEISLIATDLIGYLPRAFQQYPTS
jgi:NAD(P)H-hydrate epimerase